MGEEYNASITVIEDNLIVVLPAEMTDSCILNSEQMITDKAYQKNIRGAILNFSMVAVMDSYTYQSFERISMALSLMGIQTIWAGLSPGVVLALMLLDVTINPKIKTAANLENGLALLNQNKG